MPPKKQPASTDTEEFIDCEDPRLLMLQAKRQAIFEYIQRLYDLSLKVHIDTVAREEFLDESSQIDSLREEFKGILDEYNVQLLTLSPTAKADYHSLLAFESLYSRVKRVKCKYSQDTLPTTSRDDSVACRPKLPPIELIPFSGDIRSWSLFYASFKSTVHDNPRLTDAERLYYLLGKLTGKAQAICAGISPSAENYQLILKTLEDKFGDQRMLVAAYLNQMLDFKPLQTASTVNFDLFTEKFSSAVAALKNMKLENILDLLLIHIALQKLDPETVHAFESEYAQQMPTFDKLEQFIQNRSKILERTQPINANRAQSSAILTKRSVNAKPPPKYQTYISTTIKPMCKCLCDTTTHEHLFKCPDFHKMSPADRFRCVKENKACINCLSLKHKFKNCISTSYCRLCHFKHHSMLHFNRVTNLPAAPQHSAVTAPQVLPQAPSLVTAPSARAQPPDAAASPARPVRSPLSPDGPLLAMHAVETRAPLFSNTSTVLLSTAQVTAFDKNGKRHLIRLLLDSASQTNFITNECCNRLGIQLKNSKRTVIKGFGGAENIINTSPVDLVFFSRFDNNLKFKIFPHVVDQITDLLPTITVDMSALSYLSSLPLADVNFGTPGKVDVLVGASLFPHLLLPEVIQPRDSSLPSALRTILGYVVMGSVPASPQNRVDEALACCHVQEPLAIESLVKRFWELEELPSPPPAQHPDDVECELFYKSTTNRDSTGRYNVALPFKDDVYKLGNSYEIARRRFLRLERKLESTPKLRSAYDEVINEYITKGYISPAPPYDSQNSRFYVIPHHGVVREDKTSTKLRIVFDASAATSNNRPSLNDILHSGPNLQGDLFKIILNFRLHAIAMTADCRQQFLQIGMREADRKFQCFLYRFRPQDPLTLYNFERVCFGVKSSPYHALRTVRQLIEDDGAQYPLASSIVTDALYMDDIAFSIPSEGEAISASNQLIRLFNGARWDLVKWNSNSSAVLRTIPDRYKVPAEVEFDKSTQHKILGLHWSTDNDSFLFKISAPTEFKCTKRSILSTVARLWDIMGFVAPTVVYAKLLIKQLWQLNLDWDDTPPPHIIKMYKQFCDELPALNNLRILRHIGVFKNCELTILGFSDASEHAYGAVIYARVCSPSGITVRLVCAKSKVAPTKPLTIARLELCGAVLLSKLLRTVLNNYSNHSNIKTYAFLDSKVALYWIKSSPHRWHTFVANRVVQITDNIPADDFYYVPGVENPADVISRGVSPQKLLSHPLWARGPPWAMSDTSNWNLRGLDDPRLDDDIPEQKLLAHAVCERTPIKHSVLYELAQRISCWNKLLRIIVYISRFAKLLPRCDTIVVTAEELKFAENKMLRSLQMQHFAEEYFNIKNNKPCSQVFNRLRPFIDNGLIRVGGRLVNSALDYAQKHPTILPRNDPVINKIIDYYHVKYLHSGPELLMSLLRQKFWILSARRLVRQRVHLCNICFRLKPRPTYPLMADLPDSRTRPVIKAFTHTGCDYAGPIAYTPLRRRGVRSEKAYLCIFTCLTTRAVHIEVATDLSTPTFLAALKRFLSRRGPVQIMYSDNGTNFKGAGSYLRDLYKFLNNEYRQEVEKEYAESRITWKFICPNSPHFGGAWESIVKVVKSILFRVIGQQILSYEELITVLTQIECLLNSRPLTVLSSDPAEPSALTPSHFLNTAPLFSLPAPEQLDNLSLQHRHSLLDSLVQSFWKRWRIEYLHGLQVRQKWNTPSAPIVPGTVVIVINDNSPPLAWPLGVIEKVHPSKDKVTRVCTIRTAKGTYLRPVVRLCPLPRQ